MQMGRNKRPHRSSLNSTAAWLLHLLLHLALRQPPPGTKPAKQPRHRPAPSQKQRCRLYQFERLASEFALYILAAVFFKKPSSHFAHPLNQYLCPMLVLSPSVASHFVAFAIHCCRSNLQLVLNAKGMTHTRDAPHHLLPDRRCSYSRECANTRQD